MTRDSIAYHACGQPDAPPLVLLHGAGFNSVSWMGDVATWAQRFRVFAVDIIGHPGLSAPTRWGRRKAMRIMLGGDVPVDSRAAQVRQNLAKVKRFEDEALKRITHPLLLIVGGRDAMIDSDETRCRVGANIPTAQIGYLPDAGHALYGYADTVDKFLRAT
jgi:pimeloyl-ACP methyl ester carboxylesterase